MPGPAVCRGILLETIPGTAGILTPPAGYLPGYRGLADRHGIVLILDEVMAGFACAGEWFAFDAFGTPASPPWRPRTTGGCQRTNVPLLMVTIEACTALMRAPLR